MKSEFMFPLPKAKTAGLVFLVWIVAALGWMLIRDAALIAQEAPSSPIIGSGSTAGSGIPIRITETVQGGYQFYSSSASKTLFKISMDGEITFGDDVKPSEAAKEFAKYLKQYLACSGTKEKEKEKQ